MKRAGKMLGRNIENGRAGAFRRLKRHLARTRWIAIVVASVLIEAARCPAAGT
ncbi:hypothetical protein [Sphingomonas sp. BK580]|uniref:hypothetical protein n=1 Tax=Sphingomonas sp. BK580 TaxID=2586972 RepID=UPI00161C86B0|nr:hypothetical protein [Sphingomonas sp. BK580]MBB3695570.1 hypothetical protein [Sphingomonas sp. BK580]